MGKVKKFRLLPNENEIFFLFLGRFENSKLM